MEELKVSEEYKKAYNHADMICTHMPHLLKGMTLPENEPSEYTRGFQDRVAQFEKEKDAIKFFSVDRLKDRYSKDHDVQEKDQKRDIEKD